MPPPAAPHPPPFPPPTIFVTVGSTAFSPLIARILSPSILSLLPPNSKLLVQYGKSDLASIVAGEEGLLASSSTSSSASFPAAATAASTSAGFTQVDAGSEFTPEAGLRKTQQGGYSWKGTARSALDPGRTGSIQGWELLDGKEEGQPQGGVRRRRRRRSSTFSPSSSGSSSADADEADPEDFSSSSLPPRGQAGATILTSPPTLNFKTAPPQSVSITLMAYVPSLTPHLTEADLVIAHAGAGTILETLRLPSPSSSSSSGSPLLLLVPNESLMDNHQLELARAIQTGGWARCASLHSQAASGAAAPAAGAGTGGTGEFSSLEEELRLLLAPWKDGDDSAGHNGASQHAESTSKSAITSASTSRGTSRGERWQPRPFPRAEPERFRRLVDEEMGYL